MKDTLKNVLETGVFVCNLATKDLVEHIEATGERLPYGVDEFAHAGLDFLMCDETGAPRVANALVALECRLTQKLEIHDLGLEQTNACMVFGQVVRVHIADRLIKNGNLDDANLNQVLRGGGVGTYVEVPPSSHFKL